MYKNYSTSGQLVLPMDIEVLIPEHHLCRIVDLAVEKMNPNLLACLHPGGGRPPYHPKMMLKIILYAYTKRIYSSRQIASLLKIFTSCGIQVTKNLIFAQSIAFVPIA